MTGHIDILLKGSPRRYEHRIAAYLFIATTIKKVVLVASKVPSAPRRHEYYFYKQEHVSLREVDVFIGIHDEKDDKKQGMFEITLQGGELIFDSISYL